MRSAGAGPLTQVYSAGCFTHTDDEKRAQPGDERHRRKIDNGAGEMQLGKSRACDGGIGESSRKDDSDIAQEADEIARPADRDG